MKIWSLVRWLIVLAIVVLSAMNASWIAPPGLGVLKLIATQTSDADQCITIAGAQKAFVSGADYLMAEMDEEGGCFSASDLEMQMPQRKIMAHDDGQFEASKPALWKWESAAATACYDAYFRVGWLGIVPGECRGKTMLIPLDGQWKLWGWPNRFMARMNAANVRVVLGGEGAVISKGIEKVQQLPKVPRDFTGYLLVADIERIGPAIRR